MPFDINGPFKDGRKVCFKVNLGLEVTSDIHGNSKTRRGIHFMIEVISNKNSSTRSGSNENQRLRSTRSEYLHFLLNKVEH